MNAARLAPSTRDVRSTAVFWALRTVSIVGSLLVGVAGCAAEDDTSDTTIEFGSAPPATVTAGEAFSVMVIVESDDDVHIIEVRACTGHGVADCGQGDAGSYTTFGCPIGRGHCTSDVTLEAGHHTLVGWAHVGPDPYLTATVDVTAQ